MSGLEMVFIFFLALIIFGPKKLPEIGRQIGKALAEFRRASNEFKLQLEAEMRQIEIEEALRKEKEKERENPELTRAILPLEGAVAGGQVGSAESTLPSPRAADTEIAPESKAQPEFKLTESKEPEIKSEAVPEAVKGANG